MQEGGRQKLHFLMGGFCAVRWSPCSRRCAVLFHRDAHERDAGVIVTLVETGDGMVGKKRKAGVCGGTGVEELRDGPGLPFVEAGAERELLALLLARGVGEEEAGF